MHEKKAVLTLHALTGLHPGSGSALGVVDLPVQRERHTSWPTIPASSLKGVLRDAVRQQIAQSNGGDLNKADNSEEVAAAFGRSLDPANKDAEYFAGALSVTDARVLAYPVRSLKSVFAWVTCPSALSRLKRDLRLAGIDVEWNVPDVLTEGQALTVNGAPLLLAKGELVLEEFTFNRHGDSGEIADWFAGNLTADQETADRIKNHLVILNDDDFGHFAKHASEIVARIGLDYERKTARDGALFYQEFLPAETLFYSMVFASEDRRKDGSKSATDILNILNTGLEKGLLQVGGDETIGKGLCAVKLVEKGGE